MKRTKNICAVALTFLVVASAAAQVTPAVEEARAMFEKALASFNSGDYEGYLAHIAPDIQAYTGVYTPLRFEGKAAWQDFINGLRAYASASYQQRAPSYRSYNNDTVLCNAYFVFTTVTKDGVAETQSGRESATLVKVGGRWQIANYHFSPLF